jgi:Helix-turn-helix domain
MNAVRIGTCGNSPFSVAFATLEPRINMNIDKFTGEIRDEHGDKLVIGHGGLYSAFPIPAYQVLVKAKLHGAKDVLLCLVSHLGEGTNASWPSYTTITREAQKGRATVSQALKDLDDYGFVKTFRIQVSQKKRRNKYFIQAACYNHSLMNSKALSHLPVLTSCLYCGKGLTKAEFKIEGDKFAHWGCAGAIGTKFGNLGEK